VKTSRTRALLTLALVLATACSLGAAELGQPASPLKIDAWVKGKAIDLALRAAKLAYDDTAGNDSAVVDTYARAMFDHGRKAEAIKLPKEAIAVCRDERTRSQLEATLKQYQGSASQ
jgi:hypothetical protein